MALPELIEIEPLSAPVRAVVTVPGSKSITNRALVLAALTPAETVLEGALWSEDTQVMVEALRRLGVRVDVAPDPAEAANRTLRVHGIRPEELAGGTTEAPLELFVGNAGTAARFLTAMVALGRGVFRLAGVERMHQRPQAELFAALRQLGYRIESAEDRLPALVYGGGPRVGAACRVRVTASSQFASALLLVARVGGWRVAVESRNPEELAYVRMTEQLVRVFPPDGGSFQVEPDASSGSYFWALNAPGMESPRGAHQVQVAHWPESGWQPDAAFPRCLPLPPVVSRQSDLADSIMTAVVLAPLAERPVRFTDLGRLRLQECERVAALRTELARCGARVRERGDTLEIQPSKLHGVAIQTYNDHRIAMCFAILGLKVPGMRLHNPACVKKTFPNFFEKLAAPEGIGAVIRDARKGCRLVGPALRAEESQT